MQRAGPLAPLLMALLAKDPRNRASGAELRAEVAHLVAARPASPTEVLPSKRTSRSVRSGIPQPSTSPSGDAKAAAGHGQRRRVTAVPGGAGVRADPLAGMGAATGAGTGPGLSSSAGLTGPRRDRRQLPAYLSCC